MFINKTVQQKLDIFDDKIKECEVKLIPTKMVLKNWDSKQKDVLPQYITTIRVKIKQKHNLWKRYMEKAGLHIRPKDSSSGITNDDMTKANILNDYFASVFTNEPDGQIPIMTNRTEANMHLPNIEETEVKQYLKDLDINKSTSPDMGTIQNLLLNCQTKFVSQ